jgi:predicted nucleic acid-binding protein
MDVFVDVNIILEIVLPQRPKYNECIYILDTQDTFFVSTLTCNITMYFAEKFKLKLSNIIKFLDSFYILDLTQEDYQKAKTFLKNRDFEDALQVSCCLNNNIQKIITMDRGLYNKYNKLLQVVLV